ncbi:hypothetical protein RclHR1_10720005 [Rhizophagus clarus]|uniref:Uncharacterized protein n=1 Tax=Rhizophagus clarus TaxID=94130 RepID=A0A2Z6QH17_9GLOM|nr:hypothetical protein RclHR1_10720005 [Rhizophagus clarus]
MKVYTISKVHNSNSKQTGYFEGSELHFEANWGISKIWQTFNFEGWTLFEVRVFDSHFKSVDGFLEEISKVWNIMELQRSTTFWTHHRQNFEDLQLPNTTGLNFEDLASERNFKSPRLSESNGQNFGGLWLYSASWTFVAF